MGDLIREKRLLFSKVCEGEFIGYLDGDPVATLALDDANRWMVCVHGINGCFENIMTEQAAKRICENTVRARYFK